MTVLGHFGDVPLIVLECPDCGRATPVDRDNTDPPTAVKAVLQCDRCDDGDRHSPEYFDAAGKWVNPVDHLVPTPPRHADDLNHGETL